MFFALCSAATVGIIAFDVPLPRAMRIAFGVVMVWNIAMAAYEAVSGNWIGHP